MKIKVESDKIIKAVKKLYSGHFFASAFRYRFILTLAYIISPIDLIPDYIIGFGQIDDAAILAFGLHLLEKDLVKYREWKDRINQL